MKVQANTDSLLKSIQEAEQKMKLGLESMVRGLTFSIAKEAIDNTPYGDSDLYRGFYSSPVRVARLPEAEAGRAKGGWLVSMKTVPNVEFPDIATDTTAGNIKSKAIIAGETYNLGETVYVSNHTPYVYRSGWPYGQYGSLEQGYSNQAPLGISTPTMQAIMQVFKQDLKRDYDAYKQ